MSSLRMLKAGVVTALLIAGCDSITPATTSGPIALTPGTTEYNLRQQQLQNIRSGANAGMQNPIATGVGVGGIEREATGGAGTVGGNVGSLRTDGTIERPGAGAPPSQSVPAPRRPRAN